MWEPGRWMIGTHLSGNGRKRWRTCPFWWLLSVLCKRSLTLTGTVLALAWFSRATTAKTQQSRQPDLAATQTFYMPNQKQIRAEHVFTQQEPRARAQSQQSVPGSKWTVTAPCKALLRLWKRGTLGTKGQQCGEGLENRDTPRHSLHYSAAGLVRKPAIPHH